MSEAAGVGTFWVGSTPDRVSRGVLATEGVRWRLEVEEALFDSANHPTTAQVGDKVMHTFSPDPSMDVLDTAPRVIHGQLDDGRPVTFFDAQEVSTNWTPFFGTKQQHFGGWRVLLGAVLPDLDAYVAGVRWTLPRWEGLRLMGHESCRGGSLTPYTYGDHPGICLVLDQPASVRSLAELTPRRISTLLAIACGSEADPLHREILLSDGTWCIFGADRPPAQGTPIRSDFITPSVIDLACVAAWTDRSADFGPLPFVTARALSTTLQSDAQSLAAALEGLHRRLHKDDKPFAEVARKGLRRAVLAAADAGAKQLTAEGWSNSDFASAQFEQALNHVGQMSYADRLKVLLGPVQAVAPGLFGPDLDTWVKEMTAVRNVQSHQLTEHDDFGEQEIALYFVLGQSAAWALRIALLLTVLPGEPLRRGLRHSSRFGYALANIDAERIWKDYSCAGAFRKADSSADSVL